MPRGKAKRKYTRRTPASMLDMVPASVGNGSLAAARSLEQFAQTNGVNVNRIIAFERERGEFSGFELVRDSKNVVNIAVLDGTNRLKPGRKAGSKVGRPRKKRKYTRRVPKTPVEIPVAQKGTTERKKAA